MSDENNGQSEDSKALKAAKIAEAVKLGLPVNGRMSIETIEKMIADHHQKDAHAPAISTEEETDVTTLQVRILELAGERDNCLTRVKSLEQLLNEADATNLNQTQRILELEAALNASAGAPPPRSTPVEPQPAAPAIPAANTVECRVTQQGDNEIFTGRDDKPRYRWGDTVHLPADVAESLRKRGYVEVGRPPQ